MNSPARTPGLCGRLKLRETLSRSFFGTMISRSTGMGLLLDQIRATASS